jgi:hypothetical protein
LAHDLVADFVQLFTAFPSAPVDVEGAELLPDADGYFGAYSFSQRGENVIHAVDPNRD